VPTHAGRELLARAEKEVLGVESEVLADLGTEELRALRGLLTRLVVGPRSGATSPARAADANIRRKPL
jgi:hypothetical protein